METLFKVEGLSWIWYNAGDDLTSVDNDPIWQLKKQLNAQLCVYNNVQSNGCNLL